MSGLIWAGIGKGIADAGTSVGNMMFKGIESDIADQRAMQRAEALERLKESMLEERAQKDAAKAIEVDERATKIFEGRAAKQLDADAGKLASNAQRIAGDSPAMTAEEMKDHLESLSPAERKAVEGTGLVGRSMTRNEQRMQLAEDSVQAARELGASSTLLKSYQDTKKSVLEEIKAENLEKRNEQRHQETMAQQERLAKQFDTMSQIAKQNADANTTRANRPSGSGSGDGAAKVRSTYTDDSGQRVAVMSDGSTKVLGKAADYNKSVASMIAQREKNDFQFKNLPEEEKKAWATSRLATGPKGSDNSNVTPGSRPPLSSFMR